MFCSILYHVITIMYLARNPGTLNGPANSAALVTMTSFSAVTSGEYSL